MRHVLLSTGLAACFLVVACGDGIELPGFGRSDTPPAAPVVDVPENPPGDTAGDPGNPDPPVAEGTDDAEITDGSNQDGRVSVQPAARLIDINAIPCGPVSDAATQTLAEQIDAREAAEGGVQPAMIMSLAASLADLPGIVKLESETQRSATSVAKEHCSATRIAENWFITAAHCVDKEFDRVNIRVGAESLSAAQSIPVDYAICHAAYGPLPGGTLENDIALLRVDIAGVETPRPTPISPYGRLSQPFSPVFYSEVQIGGWGTTSYGGRLSSNLLGAELDVEKVGAAQLAVRSRDGQGPCVGDSGGPLFVQDGEDRVLMGVLSTVASNAQGGICEGDYLATYTNLAGYLDWIDGVMVTCDEDLSKCLPADDGDEAP